MVLLLHTLSGGNIGGLYPSWAWGTLLCSNDNTANFIGIANSDKTAAFAHYENGAWEKVPVESLSDLTTTNKSSLVGAINELNSKASRFSGNIKRVGFRSGQNDLKNIYLDFYDSNNAKTSLAFTTDGENTIKFLVNDEEKWKVIVK